MSTALIEYLVKELATKPQAVSVSRIENENKILFQIHVSPHDLTRIIGGDGKIFRALKAIIQYYHPGQATDLVVDIAE